MYEFQIYLWNENEQQDDGVGELGAGHVGGEGHVGVEVGPGEGPEHVEGPADQQLDHQRCAQELALSVLRERVSARHTQVQPEHQQPQLAYLRHQLPPQRLTRRKRHTLHQKNSLIKNQSQIEN